MSVEINAKMVGELRESTGAGLMDCKKALVESAGDIDAAVEILRKKGMATAAKKAGREASDGLIDTYICLLYTSPSPRDGLLSRMPSSA